MKNAANFGAGIAFYHLILVAMGVIGFSPASLMSCLIMIAFAVSISWGKS